MCSLRDRPIVLRATVTITDVFYRANFIELPLQFNTVLILDLGGSATAKTSEPTMAMLLVKVVVRQK
jgi:hypothetical protein